MGLLNEVIDRHLDGGDLHPRLTGLLGNVERIDFLVAFVLGAVPAGQGEDSSPPSPVFLAHAGHLNEGGTSTVYAYLEFAEDGHAEKPWSCSPVDQTLETCSSATRGTP